MHSAKGTGGFAGFGAREDCVGTPGRLAAFWRPPYPVASPGHLGGCVRDGFVWLLHKVCLVLLNIIHACISAKHVQHLATQCLNKLARANGCIECQQHPTILVLGRICQA